jgi:hypothetical protein
VYGFVRYSCTILGACCLAAFGAERAFMLKGKTAYGGGQDGEPGVRRPLTPEDLAAVAKPSHGLAQVVPIPTVVLPQMEDGFAAHPRMNHVAPGGDLFAPDKIFNTVHVLRVPGASDIAFYVPGAHPRWVYIANADGVVRFRYKNADPKARGKPEQIVAGIPSTHRDARNTACIVNAGEWATLMPLGAAWDSQELR